MFHVDKIKGNVLNPAFFFSLSLGFHALCNTVVLLLLCLGLGMPLGYLFELVLPLAVCAIALSYLLSMYLYIRSFWAAKHALSLGGNTGKIISAYLWSIHYLCYIMLYRSMIICVLLKTIFWCISDISLFVFVVIYRKSPVWLLYGSRAQPPHWKLWLEIFLWTSTWVNRLGKIFKPYTYIPHIH